MVGKVLDVEKVISPDGLACEISNKYNQWKNARTKWEENVKETRNYVFATDTTTTSNRTLPWANSTTTPKLCQLYDNLKANYSYALFPQTQWHVWKGKGAESRAKARTIQDYMGIKLRESSFERTVDKLVDDWILTGNCFATVEYVYDYSTLSSGETVQNYVGPQLVRISPFDIVFNPAASDFKSTPKIVRSLYSLGDLKKAIDDGDTAKADIFTKILENRQTVGGNSASRMDKDSGFIADGFGSLSEYYASNLVEVLTFYGDIYDVESKEFKTAREIQIVDRAYILSDNATSSWLGSSPIFHSGWRSRPENLYGMGPLDNLIGMQYRIDHLENLKADAFDLIATPMLVISGNVEDFDFKPAEKIIVGEEGSVSFLRPDATALNADFQISAYENKMEEFAGAPRQAMGIRTPGEKTAFEVQTLDNAGSRIFNNKAAKLEKELIEPALNAMLEAARRNLLKAEEIETIDEKSGATSFTLISREDIIGEGAIVPIGARHFAERAQRVQNLMQLNQLKQDPSIGVHLSGKRIAQILAEELNEPELFMPNVAITESSETQSTANDIEVGALEQQAVKMERGL